MSQLSRKEQRLHVSCAGFCASPVTLRNSVSVLMPDKPSLESLTLKFKKLRKTNPETQKDWRQRHDETQRQRRGPQTCRDTHEYKHFEWSRCVQSWATSGTDRRKSCSEHVCVNAEAWWRVGPGPGGLLLTAKSRASPPWTAHPAPSCTSLRFTNH